MFKQFINFQTRVFSGEDRGQVRNQGGRSGATIFSLGIFSPSMEKCVRHSLQLCNV